MSSVFTCFRQIKEILLFGNFQFSSIKTNILPLKEGGMLIGWFRETLVPTASANAEWLLDFKGRDYAMAEAIMETSSDINLNFRTDEIAQTSVGTLCCALLP